MNEGCQFCQGGTCLSLCHQFGTGEEELMILGCPFCGDIPKVTSDGTLKHSNNGCILSEEEFEIDKWNTRK